MKLRILLAAMALAVSGAAVSAAPVSLVSGVEEPTALVPGQNFKGKLTDAGADTLFSGPLSLNLGPRDYKVTFSLVAAESGFVNTLLFDGSAIITENSNGSVADFSTGVLGGKTFSTIVSGGIDLASLLSYHVDRLGDGPDLTFTSGDDEFGVFANKASAGHLSTFFLGLDDNGNSADDNHDDIIVRVDVVSTIPLPAAAWMLLAGLGGMFGLRKFRRTA